MTPHPASNLAASCRRRCAAYCARPIANAAGCPFRALPVASLASSTLPHWLGALVRPAGVPLVQLSSFIEGLAVPAMSRALLGAAAGAGGATLVLKPEVLQDWTKELVWGPNPYKAGPLPAGKELEHLQRLVSSRGAPPAAVDSRRRLSRCPPVAPTAAAAASGETRPLPRLSLLACAGGGPVSPGGRQQAGRRDGGAHGQQLRRQVRSARRVALPPCSVGDNAPPPVPLLAFAHWLSARTLPHPPSSLPPVTCFTRRRPRGWASSFTSGCCGGGPLGTCSTPRAAACATAWRK